MPLGVAEARAHYLVGTTVLCHADEYALAYRALGLRVDWRLMGLARRQEVRIPALSYL